ncbi:hypothetical protein CoNPh27_CDS0058 [Staphylococcus phage S-CoN_Ph27]|nr:hypothetical protein CoNPh27_CDS0058 [Staphylococcus phage S-CoN_Ph27]
MSLITTSTTSYHIINMTIRFNSADFPILTVFKLSRLALPLTL